MPISKPGSKIVVGTIATNEFRVAFVKGFIHRNQFLILTIQIIFHFLEPEFFLMIASS